ncbi:MAG: ABC transporter ATP-binding protein/permease [Firmicutes bacterium]|nr:ABC transporter ATP-binding protein/permease [Bacillota bacterium]MCL1953231.1 ABC transporter ATP-binding protein/permease [Bacillota bacterium]
MSENINKDLDTDQIQKDNIQGGDAFGEMVFQKPKSFWGGMSALLKYLKPWRWIIILSVLLTVIGTVMTIIAPNYVRNLTDEIFAMVTPPDLGGRPVHDAMESVKQAAIVLIVLYAISFVVSYLQAFLMAGVAANSTKKMRTDISVKINRVPLGYFDKVGFGDVLSRTTNDISTIGQSLNDGLVPTITSFVLIVGLIIVMFFTSWQMALITVATVPVSFILIGVVMGMSQKYQKLQRDYLGQLNSQIEENYSGQSVVLAYRGQKKALTNFEKVNAPLAVTAKKAEFLSGLMFPLMSFVGNIGVVAVLVGGVLLYTNGVFEEAGAGIIPQFLIYSRLFMMPFGQLAQGLGLLQSGAAGSERVFEFLNEKEQPWDVDKPTLQTIKGDPNYKVKGDVRFENVKFGYDPEHPVIKNLTEEFRSGQKIAIVGPTGAGKTTIINLLMRFYEPQSGSIYIDGVHSDEMPRAYVRGLFGMVLQDTWLFEGTIKENMIYAKENVTDEQVIEACKAVNIHHFIMTLEGGYDFKLTDDVNISVGQRQLLTIARAMVQDNPILILDEATSNVDTRTEQHIQDAMDKVSKGRTSFVIAHRLSTIKNADRILVLRDGDVIESGSHDELIQQNGFYEELYNSQFADENAE